VQQPAACHEEDPEGEEGNVPPGLLGPAAHVVDPQQVVVHQALDQVEQSPTGEHQAPERTGRPHRPPRAVRTRGEKADAGEDAQPGEDMEEPVPEGVGLQPAHRVGRVVRHSEPVGVRSREHVVPLQHLVQEYAVQEPAETHAEKQAGRRML
jgi:hypothetical protein